MSRAVITTLTILALLITSSCVTVERRSAGTPEQILNSAVGEGSAPSGKITNLPGADRSDLPYVPVIKPSEVVRIWVYDHVTPTGDLVVGHWIFVKLRPERWYIEDYSTPKPVKKIPVTTAVTQTPFVPSEEAK